YPRLINTHFFSTSTTPSALSTLSLPRRSSDLESVQDRAHPMLAHAEMDIARAPAPGRHVAPVLEGEVRRGREVRRPAEPRRTSRSEEHTSELQSRSDLVCRLLLEKKNNTIEST